jgi:hypothetical protein
MISLKCCVEATFIVVSGGRVFFRILHNVLNLLATVVNGEYVLN